MNHYQALGIDSRASAAEIKKAYRRMAKKMHPDRQGGDSRAMVRINQAHDTLADPDKRAYYDLHGEDPKRDSVETQALTTIYQILLKITEQAGEDFDFVGAVAGNLKNNRTAIANSQRELEKGLKKTEKQRKRVRHKHGKENLLDRLFQQKIDAYRAQIAAIPAALAVADKALQILEEYESPATGPARPTNPYEKLIGELTHRGLKFP